MSEDWDFYFCRVDNKPASIFVDLGVSKQAPLAQFVFMAYLRIFMRMPRPDGLSSQEEFDSLKMIQDAIEHVLSEDGVTVYVGRNTSDGCRDFYFYTKEPERWNAAILDLMRPFPEYRYESGIREDQGWGTYFDFLYPSDEDQERIQNRRTCESLEGNGDNLETEREIDHWAYFPDEGHRSAFIAQAGELGFSVRGVLESSTVGSDYGVRLFRVDKPTFDNIDSVTLPLHRLAKECRGNYDGWETQVVS